MRILKKILCLAMSALMIFFMAACDDGSGSSVLPSIGGQSGETVELTADVKLSATPLAPDRYCPVGEYESIRAI
ncbi:MAG: hypothetical protein IKM19_08660, partial [Firmicutes bacterium]|nr:hypothetical protein [Bacillota bacterium]